MYACLMFETYIDSMHNAYIIKCVLFVSLNGLMMETLKIDFQVNKYDFDLMSIFYDILLL